MKLWLLGIMACPIDKKFPLELEIFKWEGEEDNIKILIQKYNNKEELYSEDNNPLSFDVDETDNNVLKIRDDLIIKPKSIVEYLKTHIERIEEIKRDNQWLIKDSSEWEGNNALNICVDTIKQKINDKIVYLENYDSINKDIEQTIIEELKSELEFLNIFMYQFNIETGVIRCPECKRWFPITETIPQMLPDNLRDKERDKKFETEFLKE